MKALYPPAMSEWRSAPGTSCIFPLIMISPLPSRNYPFSFILTLLALLIALISGGLIWRGEWGVQAAGLAFASVVGGAYLAWRGIVQRARLVRTPLDLVILSAVAVLLLSWAFSPNLRQGMARVGSYLGYIWLFYILLDAFEAGLNRRAVLNALLLVTGFIGMMAALETYAAYSAWWAAVGSYSILPPFPYRITSLVGHSNSFMGLMNLAAPLALVTFFCTRSRLARSGAALWLAFYLLAAPFSSSRGGWLGLAAWIAALVMLWAVEKRAWRNIGLWIRPRLAWLAALLLPAAAVAIFTAYRFWILFAAHPSHGGDPFGGRSFIWANAFKVWQASSPLLGAGPGHFGYGYLEAYPHIPTAFWAIHAHSLPVEFLAEFGLAGLVVLLALVVAGSAWLWRRHLQADALHRPFSRAILAGVTAWLVQMIVDEQTAVYAVMVPLVLMLAWAVQAAPQPLLRRRLSLNLLWIPALVLIAASVFSLWAYAPAYQGVLASRRGDVLAAARLMQRSADRDPYLPYSHTQAGLAWAAAWGESGDLHHLALARAAFNRSLAMEPAPSLWWADLAVLDWYSGDIDQARRHIQTARLHSSSEPSYPLIEAWFAEQSGDLASAELHYRTALDLAPRWGSHPFWLTTPVRQKALAGCQATASDAFNPPQHISAARAAGTAGDFAQAQRQLAEARWTGEPELSRLSAQAYLAQQQGDAPAMTDAFTLIAQRVPRPLLRTGENFANIYSHWLYFRSGLDFDLVPGYLQLDADQGQFDALAQLHGMLQEQGRCSEAAQAWSILQRERRAGSLEPDLPSPPCQPLEPQS
jgi:hypothetical protein